MMRLKMGLMGILLFCLPMALLGQTGMVKGKIVEAETGNPLPGANVTIVGTVLGAAADIDGNYSISGVPVGTHQVNAAFIGYAEKTQSVTVSANATAQADFSLETDEVMLESIVVTALGFKISADKQGSTASPIAAEDMARSGEALLANSLASKASNVIVNSTTGDPGAGTSIKIRGVSSISSGQPLIIVDGIPISNSQIYAGADRDGGVAQQSRLSDINTNDIETLQVLKGASAAALWGSRAANGVIMITTKSGKAGRVKINYKRTMSFDKVHERLPMQTTFGQGRNGSYSPTSSESWGDYIPDRTGGADAVDQSGQVFEAESGTKYYPITGKNSRETYVDQNWDLAFQTGTFTDENLSISGGNERGTYLFSYGRLRQEGIIRNSFLDRDNFRLNSDFKLSDWMSVESKASYTGSNSNRTQQSSNVAGLLLGLLRNPPDFAIGDYKGTYTSSGGAAVAGRHRSYRRYLGNTSNPTYNNPLWTINEQSSTTEVDRFIMSNQLDMTPMKDLNVILRGGIDNYTDKRAYFWPLNSAGDVNGNFTENVISERELNFDAIAKTSYQLNTDIALTAVGGWNINDRKRTVNTGQINGFLVNSTKQTTNLNTAAENSSIGNSKRFIRSTRTYGVLTFDAYDQLYVNLSGAIEKTSSMNDSYFYPAADAAWQFTKYVENTPLSFGKLRASFGQVGVQPIPHRFETLAESGFAYSSYSDPLDIGLWGGGFRINDDRGNRDLRPEIKTEFELGTDLRFLDDRFSLNMTYYQNTIDDILLFVKLSPSSGYDTQYKNAGKMENKGFELDGSYTLIKDAGKNVDLNFNWSTNKNKVLDLAGTDIIPLGVGSVNSVARVGYPLGILWGTGSQTKNGEVDGELLLDDNGFPQITPDKIVLGDPNPDWRGSFGINASWKSFGLNMIVEHSQGGDYSPRTQWVLRRFGTTQETANRIESTPKDLVNFDGDVIPAGSTVRGTIQDFGAGDVLLDETWYRHGIGGGFGDSQAYNFAIKDATYTKVRELTLSYNIASNRMKEITGLSSITVSATARNLFSWYKELVGVDPAVNQAGVSNGFGLDYFTNPTTKSYLFSLSVNY